MRVVVLGVGAVGARAARQLSSTDGLAALVVADTDRSRAGDVAASIGAPAMAATWSPRLLDDADVAILAGPTDGREQRRAAEAALERGVHVVSTADGLDTVRGLLDFDAEARERALSVVVGAGFAPGLSCILARHAGASFTEVEEVHVAKHGVGGPACARARERALASSGLEWAAGVWARRGAGSGRQLAWFPDPIGGRDCYRGGMPDPLLLVPAFPAVARVTARLAATQMERAKARLPALRRPPAEGTLGAVRVEVRGRRGAAQEVRVLGALDRPAVAAGAVAAVAAIWSAEERFARPGAAGLAELVAEPVPFLRELARRGVRAAAFEGVG